MTTADVLGALARRWYVALLVLMCTAAGLVFVGTRSGVYLTQAQVRFLAPAGTQDNAFVSSSESLVAVAGLVERLLQPTDRLAATASPNVTLTDRGIYRGSAVTVPNAGGQFTYLFREPILEVQASGSTARQATAARDVTVVRIRTALRELQDRSHVPAADRIETRMVSPAPAVTYENGHPKRAAVAVAALGLGLMLLTCSTVDRLLKRRRR